MRSKKQRNYVMMKLRKAGFSQTSSRYICKKIEPVSVRDKEYYVEVKGRRKTMAIPKKVK